MLRMFISIVGLSGLSAVASAQTPESTYGQLQERLAAAEAAAVRPGDEALGCDGLATELVAVAKDPAVQAYVAKAGADAQQKYAAMEAAAAGRPRPHSRCSAPSFREAGGPATAPRSRRRKPRSCRRPATSSKACSRRRK